VSVASSFLTLADIAAPTGQRHPSPADPQSGRATRNNSDWIVASVEGHIDKSVRVTVMPSEVVRDDSWPAPFEFLSR